MKKRISSRKKAVKLHKKAWHKKKHLRVHAILIYTSATIFLFSIFAAAVHVFIKPIAQQNETYYASTLGETENVAYDEFSKEMKQLEEEMKTTEKEISELNSDKLYEKTLVKPTSSQESIEFKKQQEEIKPEFKPADRQAKQTGSEEKKLDEIVEKVIATGVIDIVDEESISTDSGDFGSNPEGDEFVYKIDGLKEFKFLGFIPVQHPVTAIVSSETGDVIKTEQPFFTSFVDLLSP